MSKVYVIDIDDTICKRPNGSDYENSIPIRNRIAQVNKLYDDGNIIKYFTARGMGRYNDDLKLAKSKFYNTTETQLKVWGCKYHVLIFGKPSADYYIDDKAIRDNDFFN